ncbi:hypothetical protein JKP88DRAFT_203737 [Tribonema minus]|uniref:RRM domain-containing protein n=1 Tax=Tribonema minus TaxID=303371 RepID=A0A836C6T3_9STRA|nr:hypothetical protein JKP88DRAFT_203737 [Tribonema minus]
MSGPLTPGNGAFPTAVFGMPYPFPPGYMPYQGFVFPGASPEGFAAGRGIAVQPPLPGVQGVVPVAGALGLTPGAPIQTTKDLQGPDGCNLFVFHIPNDMTNNDLYALFSDYGEVISARIMVDKVSGRSRGFGFVSFSTRASAEAAIKGMNGFHIGHKRLKVQHKMPKDRMDQTPTHLLRRHNSAPSITTGNAVAAAAAAAAGGKAAPLQPHLEGATTAPVISGPAEAFPLGNDSTPDSSAPGTPSEDRVVLVSDTSDALADALQFSLNIDGGGDGGSAPPAVGTQPSVPENSVVSAETAAAAEPDAAGGEKAADIGEKVEGQRACISDPCTPATTDGSSSSNSAMKPTAVDDASALRPHWQAPAQQQRGTVAN